MLRAKWLAGLVIIFLAAGWVAGCSNGGKNAEKKPAGEEKPKAPSALRKIIQDIDKINGELEGKLAGEEAGNDKGNEGDMESQDQKQESGKEGSLAKGKSKAGQESDYRKEKEMVQKMYKEWNALEPDLVKAGIGNKEREDFRKGLDKLAIALEKEQKGEALLAGISMYKYYAGISKGFEGVVPSDFYLVKYEALMAASLAEKGNFREAESHIISLFEYWSILKMQKKQGEEGKLFTRTELSLSDLQKVIKVEQSLLVPMKIKVVKDNLQAVEESLSRM